MPYRFCDWSEIESDSGIYNTCKEGEEFHLTPELDLWPYCHLCGGRIRVVELPADCSCRGADRTDGLHERSCVAFVSNPEDGK